MPKTPHETRLQIRRYADHLRDCADDLMKRRAYLNMGDLLSAQQTLSIAKAQLTSLLETTESDRFNQNIEIAEDFLAGLIRRVYSSRDESHAFTAEVRQFCSLLRAAANVISAFTPLLLALLPPQLS